MESVKPAAVSVRTIALVVIVLIPYATVTLTFRTALWTQGGTIAALVGVFGLLALPTLRRRWQRVPAGIRIGLLAYSLAAVWGCTVGLLSDNPLRYVASQGASMLLLPAAVAAFLGGRHPLTPTAFVAGLSFAAGLALVAHLGPFLGVGSLLPPPGEQVRLALRNEVSISGTAVLGYLSVLGWWRSTRKPIAMVALVAFIVLVVGTMSRGAWLAALVGTAAWAVATGAGTLRAATLFVAGWSVALFGLVGLIGATLVGSLLVGIVLRAVLQTSLTQEGTLTSITTPHPDFAAPLILSGGEDDRVTILLLGADTRPAETGYRMPTDTIMLLSIDTKNQQAGILSIPRDLYVDIPGHGLDRINTAYVQGGGPVAMETIERNIGVEIDHYVLVQFDAFTTIVDEIGGIDIYVPYTIDDPTFPAECYSRDDCGFDPLYLEAGQHHFDGQTALRYARTRHGDNDYERARRQQAVIMAVRQRVLSFDMLPRLITKAPSLYNTLSRSISTDMSLEEIVELAQAASALPDDSIRSDVVDADAVSPYRAPNGASVLMPNHERIKELAETVFWLEE